MNENIVEELQQIEFDGDLEQILGADLMARLFAALAQQPESEPAAEVFARGPGGVCAVLTADCPPGTKLYKRPQPTPQVPEERTNAQLHGCQFAGWQCFHCGEVFTTVGGAADHFGADPHLAKPGCMERVQLGEERGLLMELRKAEKEIAEQGREWISCEDRLPSEADGDYDGRVWVFDSWKGIVVPCLFNEVCDGVTHWMPTGLVRPVPPAGGEAGREWVRFSDRDPEHAEPVFMERMKWSDAPPAGGEQ